MEIVRNISSYNFEQLVHEIKTGMGLDLFSDDGHVSNDENNNLTFYFVVDLTAGEITTLDTIISNHVDDPNWTTICHRICEDVDRSIKKKPVYNIDYKTELKSGISYTPVYYIGSSGTQSGLIEKTEYYRGFVDKNNKGTIILEVVEEYVIDDSEVGADYTRMPVIRRTKYWKYYLEDGTIDEKNIKSKTKEYDTRTKRHLEGVARRGNVIEQLIDNVGLAGVLSGVFTSEEDAHSKLTDLKELHGNAFSAWVTSGLGSLTDVILTDTTTTWLSGSVADTPYTQVMCPWMIGLTFRSYIIDKLKGNIK